MPKKFAALFLLVAVSGGNALAASFDCKKATAPIEAAICKNADLSLADDVLTESYRFLIPNCPMLAGIDELKAAQNKWLSEVRSKFRDSASGLGELRKQYEERNAYLTQRLSECSLARNTPAPVAIKTLSSKKLEYTLPYVVASSPEIGRRINNAIFNELLDMPAPGKLRDGLNSAEVLYGNEGMRSLASAEYSVLRNDGRLLVLEINGEGCGAYCENFTTQYLFDVRTGRAVHPKDLFTNEGANILAQRLKSNRILRGKNLLAKARKARSLQQGDEDTYQQCLRDWSEFESRLWPMAINAKGVWRFVAGTCSAHVNRPSDLLDGLDESVSLKQLEPHLNAYGRSLLLGVGDVRDPGAK